VIQEHKEQQSRLPVVAKKLMKKYNKFFNIKVRVPELPKHMLRDCSTSKDKHNHTHLSTVSAGAGAASDSGFICARNMEKLAPLAGEIRCAVSAFFLRTQ